MLAVVAMRAATVLIDASVVLCSFDNLHVIHSFLKRFYIKLKYKEYFSEVA